MLGSACAWLKRRFAVACGQGLTTPRPAAACLHAWTVKTVQALAGRFNTTKKVADFWTPILA